MYKFFAAVIMLSACGPKDESPPPDPKVFQVRCPLTTVESATDTLTADAYGYYDSALRFYKGSRIVSYKQFPGTCVVKEITE